MSHALIIEKNMVIGSALSKRLVDLGFDSFDHVWTEEDALEIASRHPPDLILVGDSLETGDTIETARKICQKRDVPVLLVTADSPRARERLSGGAVLDGPFAFSQMTEVVDFALHRSRPTITG